MASSSSSSFPRRMELQKLLLSAAVFSALLSLSAVQTAAQPRYACDTSNPLTKTLPFCKTSMPMEERVRDVVSRLALDEKILQLVNDAPAIPRLGIPAHEWWSEALHGLADFGYGISFRGTIPAATLFPQVILTAATFDAKLWYQIGQVESNP
ncbi:putative beta-D-xylosidase 7, partial [Cucurbita argyrosperma subsp. sororia]